MEPRINQPCAQFTSHFFAEGHRWNIILQSMGLLGWAVTASRLDSWDVFLEWSFLFHFPPYISNLSCLFLPNTLKKKNLLKKVEWLLLNQMKIPVVTLCLAPCLNPIFYQEAVVLQKSHDTFTPTLRLCPSRMQISYYLSPPIHTVNIHSFRLELRSQKFRDTTSSHPNG